MEKDTGVQLTCAVSEDGYSFVKTGLDVEIPTVDNRTVTAISVENGSPPFLYFTANGARFVARSNDLLHFEVPTPCAHGEGEKEWITLG
jgi:hypothetical protein